MTIFDKAWGIVKEENPVSVSVGRETIEVSCIIDGERKRKRYQGYSKEEAEQKFRQEFGC
jgi:hypothetical protein|tara:strand:- start:222 stop:401 length:180 start_codon:yes stop_codon:yes gene_type:complete